MTALLLKIRKDGLPWREVQLDEDPTKLLKLRAAVAKEMRSDGWRHPEHADRFTVHVRDVRFPDRSFDLAV